MIGRAVVLLALASLAGCSGGDDFDSVVCEAGATQACVCKDGRKGAQICAADETRWGACECEGTEPAAGSGGGSGSGGSASAGTNGGGSSVAGASSKDCNVDSDCPDTAKPYCIEWSCQYRLGPNASCDPDLQITVACAPGYFCDSTVEDDYGGQCRPMR